MELSDHHTDMSDELERKVLAQAEELRLVRAQLDDVLRRVAALESRGSRRSALPQRQASASSLRSDSPPPATPPPLAVQSQAGTTPGTGTGAGGSLATSKRWSSTGDFNQHRQTPHTRLASAKSLFNLSPGGRLGPPPAEADWSATERCIRVGGAVLLAPTNAVLDAESVAPPPQRRLRIGWVHGFKGRDARSCLHLLPTGETVYLSACLVVLHGLAEGTQRHYQGHTDTVLCLTVHPNRMTLASGQGGQQPHVRVWDSVSLATTACVGLGHFDFPVRCVGFSKADGGGVLCAVDDSPDHVLSLWSWQRGTLIAHAKGSCEPVTWAEFHPLDAALVTAGKNHLAFWTAHGTTLFKMAAVFEARLRPKFVTAVAFAQSGAAISGDSSGNVTLWARGGPLSVRCARNVTAGPVLTLLALRDGRLLAGGGKDGRLALLDEQLRVISETALPSDVGGVRAVVEARQGRLIVGTTRNCVLEGPLSGPMSVVVRGHADTVVALATHPTRPEFAAAGLDGLVVLRESETHAPIRHFQLPAGCHSLDYSPDGLALLAGLSDGRWLLLATESGGGGAGGGVAGDAPITACAFSPDGAHVALGSADGSVYLSDGPPRFDRIGRCLGHSSAVIALDWSEDGQLLRSNSANGELLFWSGSSCRQVVPSSRPRDATWASLRCTLSFDSAGATSSLAPSPPGHAHKGAGLLAVGGVQGLRLMTFPARPRALSHRYAAHSAIAAARFDHAGDRLITAGGEDATVIAWDVQ